MPQEFRTRRRVSAYCDQCDKYWEGKNAHGVGAQHARRYGHYVSVEIVRVYVYDHGPGTKEEAEENDEQAVKRMMEQLVSS